MAKRAFLMGAGPAAALPSGLVPLMLLEPLPTVAAKNKSLAKNNKSRTEAKATKKREIRQANLVR